MLVRFYGNNSDRFDRIPDGTPGMGKIPKDFTGKIWRTDCNYALSPYWEGEVICEVPDGCDFTQHPPKIVEGFRVIEVLLPEIS